MLTTPEDVIAVIAVCIVIVSVTTCAIIGSRRSKSEDYDDPKEHIYVIFAQRLEAYEGQYAPEALEVMDQYAYDENPEWLNDKLKHYRSQHNQFENVQLIRLEYYRDDVDDILRPAPVDCII